MLGDNSSGKTSLIAKLQGVEDPKKGSGLEYAYIDVRDEYRDGELRKSSLDGSFTSFLPLFQISRDSECGFSTAIPVI